MSLKRKTKTAMSDTPRTDAALIQRGLDPDSTAPFVKFVRKLEREAAELRALLTEARKWMDGDVMNDPWEKTFCEKIDAAIKRCQMP